MTLPIVALTAGSILSAAYIYTGTLPPVPAPTLVEREVVVEVEAPFPCWEDEVLDVNGDCTPVDDMTPFASGRTCTEAEAVVLLEDADGRGWEKPFVCVSQTRIITP